MTDARQQTHAPASGKVVLVTGATAGIGQACAERLAQAGWRVFGGGRRASDGLTVNGVELLRLDVDDEASVTDAVAAILARAGRLDAVVNNAGFSMRGAVEDTTIDEAKAIFQTNFFGALRVCRAALPALRASGGGHIVNMSSIAGAIGVPFTGLYSASKFALEGVSESLRLEARPFGVHVVIVEPGDFRSEIHAKRRLAAPPGSPYRDTFARFLEKRGRFEAAAPGPEPVARLVERILNDPAPKARYAVAMPAQRLLLAAKRILPQALFEGLFARLLGL